MPAATVGKAKEMGTAEPLFPAGPAFTFPRAVSLLLAATPRASRGQGYKNNPGSQGERAGGGALEPGKIVLPAST
jgi:hypothetical protein